MRKYCLKPSAKEQLKQFTDGLIYPIVFVLFVLSIAELPFALTIGCPNQLFVILAYIGILSWTGVLSLIVISIKRWLQSNIVRC